MIKKTRKQQKRLSEIQIELIETLAGKGMPDSEIAKQMDLHYNQIAYITTRYWKQKMKDKDERKL